ncbi:MAG: hypothetical protein P4L39_07350 [Humidesulfovibrio sp.]|nr:hypothetical protein [Humidesulfovibrio sp.]
MPNASLARMLRASRWTFVLGLLATAVALGLYFRAGLFEFCTFDDPSYVSMNQQVLSKFTWSSVVAAFSPHQVMYWHPMTTLSFMLDGQFFHLWAGGYHLTNVLWHTANVALFFLLVLWLTGNRFAAVFAALLLAAHPAHVEAIAWISARKDVLSTFFGLASILLYIRWARKPGAALALGMYAAYALSLMAKPMFVTMAGLLLLLDYWPLGRLAALEPTGEARLLPDARHLVACLREKVLFLALGLFSTFMTLSSHADTQDKLDPSWGLKIANAFAAIAKYLGLLVWPSHQAMLYPFPDAVPLVQSLGGAVLVLAVTVLCLWQARRRAYLLVGWLWFLCALTPVIMPPKVGLHVALADRWTYVPFLGLYLAICGLAAELLGRIERPVARAAAAIALVALPLVPLSIAQQRQLSTWATPASVYEQDLRVTKGSYLVMSNYGVMKQSEGDLAAAERYFLEALRYSPDFAICRLNLGALRIEQGRDAEALDLLWPAMLRLEKEHQAYDSYRALALLLTRGGKLKEAQGFYALAIREQPKRAEAYVEWGGLARRLGDLSQAREFFDKGGEAPNAFRAKVSLDSLKALLSQP